MFTHKNLFLLFLPGYFASLFLGLSSQHLFSFWLSLELNLLFFLGILIMLSAQKGDPITMKYFLPQALGSGMLFLMILFNAHNNLSGLTQYIFAVAFLLKLGVFPFHNWFISAGSSAGFLPLWMVSIPQKILPFWGLMNTQISSMLILSSVLGSVVISVSNSFKTTRILYIFIFSSIFNSGWLLILMRDYDIFFPVMFIYGMSLFLMTNLLNNLATPKMVDVQLTSQNWILQMSFILGLINLAGMPPFMNMWVKIISVQVLLLHYSLFWVILFILSSAAFFYIYIRLGFVFMVFNSSKLFLQKNSYINYTSFSLLLFSGALFFS